MKESQLLISALVLILVSLCTASAQPNANYTIGSSSLYQRGTFPNANGASLSPVTGKILIADDGNNVLYRYSSSALLAIGASPEFILQPVRDKNSYCVNGGFSEVTYMSIDQYDSLWIAGFSNNRVTKITGVSYATSTFSTVVLGQTSFDNCMYGRGTGSMSHPSHAFSDIYGGNLWVADSSNNRVMRFDDYEFVSSGTNASLILGTGDSGTSPNTLNFPVAVALDSQNNLYVADQNNNRIMIFKKADSLQNGDSASVVIGQDSFDNGAGGVTQYSIHGPNSVFWYEDTLYVADLGNNRVMVFSDTSSLQTGAVASYQLGQPDFETSSTRSTSPSTITNPTGLFYDSGCLLVVAQGDGRTVQYVN